MDKIYTENPEVLAYFALIDGKLIFDFDDKRVPIEQIMVALHQTTGEYIKALADQSPQKGE